MLNPLRIRYVNKGWINRQRQKVNQLNGKMKRVSHAEVLIYAGNGLFSRQEDIINMAEPMKLVKEAGVSPPLTVIKEK